ncbi:hypothetical protein [Hydrogenophaga sp. 5NK40-0174]|uniref:hypothetical protein n=1 Tax=Hydrogenophaga sp. 5NK40-0174 TaxID=3127649 RepID=UPI00310C41AD
MFNATPHLTAVQNHPRWRFWVHLLVSVVVGLYAAQLTTGDSIKGDATQNLKIVHNLYHHHVYALEADATDHEPTNFREPVPVWMTWAWAQAMLPKARPDEFEKWHGGDLARQVKQVNALWSMLGLLCALELAVRVMRRPLIAYGAVAVSVVFFFARQPVVDSLYTEMPAGALMLACALATWRSLEAGPGQRSWMIVTGVCMAAMCLTKSVFAPVCGGWLILLLWAQWRQQRAGQAGESLARAWPWKPLVQAGVIAVLLVFPWTLRNHLAMDTWEVSSGRAGYVMFKRALMDQMSDDEYALGWSVFGSYTYRRLVSGTSLAVKRGDRQLGGRLQRLNPGPSDFQTIDKRSIAQGRPEQSLTFYRKPAALYQRLYRDLEQAGVQRPDLAADRIMKAEALRFFVTHPVLHLKLTPYIFWRGVWTIRPPAWAMQPVGRIGIDLLNLLGMTALVAWFVRSFWRSDVQGLLWSGLPVLMMLNHALLTQGLPRFNLPVIPFMCLALGVTLDRLRPPR